MQRDGEYIPYAESGPYPIRNGNRVAPLVDGEPAFRRICEAVEGAKRSVWVTIAFLHPDFQMPDGRGSLFDVLDAAVDRGLDVRVIFWRHWLLAEADPQAHFAVARMNLRQVDDLQRFRTAEFVDSNASHRHYSFDCKRDFTHR